MRVILLASVLLFSGCAQLDVYESILSKKGAEFYDRELNKLIYLKCEALSVGAWNRKYGNDLELANAWRVECRRQSAALPNTKEAQ
jgi:hypothetical protein